MDSHTNALVHSFVIHFFRSRSAAISPSKVSAFLRNHHNRISQGLFELLDKVQRVDTKSQFCPWELCLLVANSFFCLLAGGHWQGAGPCAEGSGRGRRQRAFVVEGLSADPCKPITKAVPRNGSITEFTANGAKAG